MPVSVCILVFSLSLVCLFFINYHSRMARIWKMERKGRGKEEDRRGWKGKGKRKKEGEEWERERGWRRMEGEGKERRRKESGERGEKAEEGEGGKWNEKRKRK